jgi:predicted thioesterase
MRAIHWHLEIGEQTIGVHVDLSHEALPHRAAE